MRVLFVASGNSGDITPLVKNQIKSIQENGIDSVIFPIVGKGLPGYLRNILLLKKHLKYAQYDLIHAHYALSGYVAALAGAKPLIVSLMGSDLGINKRNSLQKYIMKKYWNETIVKSKTMREAVGECSVEVIPNGVNIDKLKPLAQKEALKKTNWDLNCRHILFAANPKRPEKNYQLLQSAFERIKENKIQLHFLDNVPNEVMPFYYNAADVVVLTSLREGSPNVIKEAMACNRPIVATAVGDVAEIIDGVSGCFLCDFDPVDLASKLTLALKFNKPTSGRDKIIVMGLDDKTIAAKIIAIYRDMAE
ncbi:MAG: glycosyltransferase [Syntrophaceae bacterium]|nr:glycosyltransferase [Syntrophaceae bacterium]